MKIGPMRTVPVFLSLDKVSSGNLLPNSTLLGLNGQLDFVRVYVRWRTDCVFHT
jgi:hypothetical protein